MVVRWLASSQSEMVLGSNPLVVDSVLPVCVSLHSPETYLLGWTVTVNWPPSQLSPYDSWDGLQLNWNPDLDKWKKMDGIIFI